jgi:anti-anti-sigma factor
MAAHHGPPWLDREDVGDVTVVRFRLKHLREEENNRAIFHLLLSLVEAGRHRLVLNLGTVESLTSDAIGQLVLLNRKVQAGDGRLALCALTPGVGELFLGMHLQEVLDIQASEAEAIQSFSLTQGESGDGQQERP